MSRLITVLARHVRPLGVRALSQRIIVESPFGGVTTIPDDTLPEYVWKDVPRWADKPAITCSVSGRSYTFIEARGLSHRFATALLSQTGLKPGDIIGLHLPNIPEFLPVMYGALEAGLVITFINPLYTPDEVRRQFEDAGVKCCVTLPQLFPILQQVLPTLKNYKCTVMIGSPQHDVATNTLSFQKLVTEPGNAEIQRPDTSKVALLPYSSGTMGAPKGVKLSHKNLVSNLEQNRHPDILDHIPTSDTFQERVLSVLPFFHIFGFNTILNTCLIHGLHTIIMPKFTPEDYVTCLVKYKPTFLFLVPSLLQFLSSHPAVKKEHLQSVKKVVSGAASASKALIEKFIAKTGRDDIRVTQGYGMTESSPVLLNARSEFPKSKQGSAGQLIPLTQARVVDTNTGEDLGPKQTGELLFKGPQVMMGYLNNEEATRETIDKDGWLHTGDVGYYDEDGYFFIVDRTKELIKVKGNQVSPAELEGILIEMPGVADIAVVGIPDDKSGEVPRAFVVKQHGANITENDIIKYVEPRVVKYKQLAGGVKFLDAIPRNAAGKVIRQQLKASSINKS